MSGASRRDDAGWTLIELLLSLSLFMVLGALLLTTLVATTQSSRSTRMHHDLNEEARNAINRMARELRQADTITYAVNADGASFDPDGLVAVSLRADFNQDGCSGNACPSTDLVNNPEDITYCFDPTSGTPVEQESLWLIPAELTAAPASCNIAGAQPILAGKVKAFEIDYRSNAYLYDTAPADGVTTWEELDGAGPPIGDAGASDGDINTAAIEHVNSVVIHLSMGAGSVRQDYQTQVDLRNES